MGNSSSEVSGQSRPARKTPFGKEMAKHFLFDPSYRNMNHGSFGTYPRAIRERLRELQDAHEARPDIFIRYEYPALLDESRAVVSKLLNAPIDAIVFVPNSTTAFNTVLRNLTWNPDGKDEILYFDFIYGSCGKTITYVCESQLDLVSSRKITVHLPFSTTQLLDQFTAAIAASKSSGHHPRVAVFDTIVSMPGIILPYIELTKICKDHGIFSLIDGAHGMGQIELNIEALDPDFFMTNCHKWFFAPRGCAILYVPLRHQHLMRSTLPTSHGFIPKGQAMDRGPLPVSSNTDFVTNFEFVGTIDSSPYLCISEAARWREEVCGGEKAIMDYCIMLAKEGGKRVAEILGTDLLNNEEGNLTECAMVNVRLPISGIQREGMPEIYVPEKDKMKAATWMLQILMDIHNTFIAIIPIGAAWYVRLSAQVYLDLEDFEWTGKVLKVLVERVGKREYLESPTGMNIIAGKNTSADSENAVV